MERKNCVSSILMFLRPLAYANNIFRMHARHADAAQPLAASRREAPVIYQFLIYNWYIVINCAQFKIVIGDICK